MTALHNGRSAIAATKVIGDEGNMTTGSIRNNPNYDPNALLDWFADRMKLKTDAAMAYELEVLPPVISKIRHRRVPIGPTMLIVMHDLADMRVRELRKIMGL